MEPNIAFTAGAAARAADIPLRAFRHLVMQGFDLPGHTRRKWHRFDAASVVVLAVAGRLTLYGLSPRDALAVAVEMIEPELNPIDGYSLTPPFILRALRGCRLEVAFVNRKPVATINPKAPAADAVVLDIDTLAVGTIDRLNKESNL